MLLVDIHQALRYRFNIRDDEAAPSGIDGIIRDNVVFKGTKLWVPILAILVASTGLKVNASAVIIAALLSSIASTAYFPLAVLSEAQSELFARTTPAIRDVLIALFGGMAGMIAATRKK